MPNTARLDSTYIAPPEPDAVVQLVMVTSEM